MGKSKSALDGSSKGHVLCVEELKVHLQSRAENGARWNACLACMGPWVRVLVPTKPGMVRHACNQSILEVEAERSKAQNHPQLVIEFEVSLSYMRPCLRKKKSFSTIHKI